MNRASVESLEVDGRWCPMAHCNQTDDSFHDLPPLREARTSQRIADPVVSPYAWDNLGAYTGEEMAVCAYESPRHPALVGYDHQDGSIKWTSPPADLPGDARRRPNGIAMAKMGIGGKPARSYVFASNPAEFVAYAADGTRLWKRRTTEIAGHAPRWIGAPSSLRLTDAKELVAATTEGWVVKLNPADGSTIDAYRMETDVAVGGRLYRGILACIKSPAVIGDVLYCVVQFRPHPSNPLAPRFCPVHLVRVELSQPGRAGLESAIRPLGRPESPRETCPDRVAIGVYRGGGSPPAWRAPDGKVLVFGHASAPVRGQLRPAVTAVEDDRGVLGIRWRSLLDVTPWDDVYAAPALHGDSRTLLVPTLNGIHVFRRVDSLSGDIPSVRPLSGELVQVGTRAPTTVRVGSPFALTFDPDADEIVAYTNFRVSSGFGVSSYGFLGAFALPPVGRSAPRPLWCRPLAVTPAGAPAPGVGTAGQPALFRYDREGEEATAVIVNTVSTGTYIIR